MPTVTAYRNGSTAGVGGGNPNPQKRQIIKGWSTGAVRRHTAWLYGVDAPALTGRGFALTLTMKHTPESADALHAIREAFIKRLLRLGAIRTHWVIEWQRRGTPHLHCAIYFPDSDSRSDIDLAALMLTGWLYLTRDLGAMVAGQDWNVIDGDLGWLQYLSKHASRGVKHFQRSGRPEGWERTGRLWGHGGQWPTDAPLRFDMPQDAYWRYRRLVRAWRVADARKSGNVSRIVYARKMLACPDPRLSAVRGVSDWLPESVSLDFIVLLISQGYAITERSEGVPGDSAGAGGDVSA